MAFNLDTANPINAYVVAQYPGNERAFRTAVKGMLEVEHDTVDGRHKFGQGTTVQRNAITKWVVGSVWFNTDRHTGRILLDLCKTIGPVTWEETDVVFLDESNTWTKGQQSTYLAMTTNGSGPMLLRWTPKDRNVFKHILTEDSQMENPFVAIAADDFSTWVFEITQNGAGGHTLTFDTDWLPDGGGQVAIGSAGNAVTYIRAHSSADQKVIYEVSPR